MNNVVAMQELPTHPPISAGGGNYITSYDPMKEAHVKGLGDLMGEQGKAHGRNLSKEWREVIANQAGQQYQCTFVCKSENSRPDSVLTMATTTEATLAEGRVAYLEDIVTTSSARKRGLATRLMNSLLIRSWEAHLKGLAWETGRNNESARMLYLKFDPQFSTSNLPSVWRLSPAQLGEIAADAAHRAVLAVPDNMMSIVTRTLIDHQQTDTSYLTEILERQVNNGLNATDFVVMAHDNSIAIVSQAYSTFQAKTRADARIYMSGDVKQENISELIRGIGHEVMRRPNWRGSSAQIELVTDIHEHTSMLSHVHSEKRKLAMAESMLQGVKAERLKHAGDEMVAYALTGKRYIAAVINAIKDMNESPFSPEASARLKRDASKHQLAFGIN